MKILLEDIIPEQPEFYLKAKSKKYVLKIPNLEDQTWLNRNFDGPKGVEKVFSDRDWPNICRIVYKLLDNEARGDFLAQEAILIDDEGRKQKKNLTGPELLFISIADSQESARMLGALLKAIMNSNPLIEAHVLEELKKNLRPDKSLILPLSQTGQKSSTRSRRSTGGRKKKS